MGLGFMSGFMTGLGQGLDDFNKNELKRRADDASNKARIKEANAKIDKIKSDFRKDAETSIKGIREKIAHIKSSDYKGTEENRISDLNIQQNLLFSKFKELGVKGNQEAYGFDINSVLDPTKEYIGQYKTVKEKKDGEVYVVTEDHINALNASEGLMRFKNGRFEQKVFEPNSQGTMVPAINEQGNEIWEDSGVNVPKYSDFFKLDSKEAEGYGLDKAGRIQKFIELSAKKNRGETLSKEEEIALNAYRETEGIDKSTGTLSKSDRIQKIIDLEAKQNRGEPLTENEKVELSIYKQTEDIDSVPSISKEKSIQYNEYAEKMRSIGQEPLSPAGWEERAKMSGQKDILKQGKVYALKFKKGKSKFNESEAIELESHMKTTTIGSSKHIQDKEEEFTNMVNLEEGYNNLYSEWKTAVDSGLYKSGPINTLLTEVAQYTPEEFLELFDMTSEELSTRLGIDTAIGDIMVKYIKLISGLAVSNQERATLTEIMFGSKYKTAKARMSKFKSFMSKHKRDTAKKANDLLEYRPHTAGKYLNKDKRPPMKGI